MATARTASPESVLKHLSSLIAKLGEQHPGASAVDLAVDLARHLQNEGHKLQTPQEKKQQAELERMLQSPVDRYTLTQLTDQAFRSNQPRRVADQLTHILDVQGVPRFFGLMDRAMLRGFQSFGGYLPGVAVPMVKGKMREETANVILPAESEVLTKHLEERRQQGVRMNVNYLGEALLGEEDARGRLEAYLAALQIPEIEVISVKVSTIYSQLSPIARHHAVKELCDRMELLYRAAAKASYKRADGTESPKFVYLDMEEYRDLHVTVETFIETLNRPGLEQASAGIALQAYIPDSYQAQLEINEWAKKRVAGGGAPVTVRLVKGANLEMERVEASVAGWPQAPYTNKRDTDANFKRMLHEALEPDNIAAVHLGVASHNLFEVAYALVLASQRGLMDRVQFEMLEGMANHQRRAIGQMAPNLLLYAPATRRENFINAVGYLIRRLDENTGPENFLRHAFKMKVDSAPWKRLESAFVDSFAHLDDLSSAPRRQQNRNSPPNPPPADTVPRLSNFVNEPDTDFSLPQNLEWAESIIERWKARTGDGAADIPLVIAGEEIRDDRTVRVCLDPSRPGVVVGRYRQASEADIDRALDCAHADPTGWRSMNVDELGEVMTRVAHELRTARGDLMGAAMAEGGKLFTESDPEVSEAIDFVNYYTATARDVVELPTLETEPAGVILVVPPWNFPLAIPCGGISAALAAGNTVILKPASHTTLCAWELCKCFWRAGVPKEVLQFVPCAGATGGARLAASDVVDAVILTGGTDTALRMLEAKPSMNLLAETGGKNATIVTGMSDREQAIKHVLHSAFSHSGQKCSATSLLILEAEVYDDPHFKETLCDAVRSLRVGSAWSLDTRVGPVIRPPDGVLEVALKELEEHESWAVMPHQRDDNPSLYSPAVKWGVTPGSFTHMTEFFGPVLAVMRARDLDEAIDLVNQTGYGLTSGIETLDLREQERWLERIRAGNLYVNRVTTGAVVQRQPFGGMGKSAFGPGIKAGGPNYALQLMRIRDCEDSDIADVDRKLPDSPVGALVRSLEANADTQVVPDADRRRLARAAFSFAARFDSEFGREHDHVALVGQDNIRRYLPVGTVRIRIHHEDTPFDVFARACAARTAGCRIVVSTPPGPEYPAVSLLHRLTESWAGFIEFVDETDEELAKVIRMRHTDRVRYAERSRVPELVRKAVGDSGIYIADAPVLAEGRIELLWYLQEQSISSDYHRYGNLGVRGDEERRPVQ